MKNKNDHLIKALEELTPTITWEDISTGGGCTCIFGQFKNQKNRVIMITDGDAHSPESFTEEACAIYWEDHEMNEYWHAKAWTEPKPFFKLLVELRNDLNEWGNEETELEKMTYRLTEFAEDLEQNQLNLSAYAKTQLIDDLHIAVQLLKTHATIEG